MKLLADLSLLSSPYTWMTPPGRAPSPDVGDVLLAGDERDPEGLSPLRSGFQQVRAADRRVLAGAHGLRQASQTGSFFLGAEGRPLYLPRSPRSWPRCRTTAEGDESQSMEGRGEKQSQDRRDEDDCGQGSPVAA